MATFEAYGNSRTYSADINGERVTAARIEMSPQALSAAETLELKGGNLTVTFAGNQYSVEKRDETLYIDA